MAGKKRDDVREEDVTGLKYFDKLAPLLARLHGVGCQRDKAGNRRLHFDQYCMLVLLFLFNPVVRSLRAIEQASELRKVQRKLGCRRASLGSLSEATDVFQPERLKEVIAELGDQLQPIARDPRLKDVPHVLTLVDGTLLKGLPVLVQAALPDPRRAKLKAKFRLHTQFDLERGVPIRIDVTEGVSRGEADERAVLGKALQTGRCYVKDRGYAKFALFNAIVAADSSYVCRLRDNSRYEIEQERPSRSSPAAGRREDHTARETRRRGRSGQQRAAADRDQLAGFAGLDHCADLPLPLDDRNLLSLLQARARLPALAEPRSGGHRDSDLLRDHRLHAHQPVDGPQADPADVRDDLPLLHGFGGGGRTAGPFGQTASPLRLRIPVRRSAPCRDNGCCCAHAASASPRHLALSPSSRRSLVRSTRACLPSLNANAIIVPNRIGSEHFFPIVRCVGAEK